MLKYLSSFISLEPKIKYFFHKENINMKIASYIYRMVDTEINLAIKKVS